MTEPRKPHEVKEVGEEQEARVTPQPPSKTLQELERLQFDAVERSGFESSS